MRLIFLKVNKKFLSIIDGNGYKSKSGLAFTIKRIGLTLPNDTHKLILLRASTFIAYLHY